MSILNFITAPQIYHSSGATAYFPGSYIVKTAAEQHGAANITHHPHETQEHSHERQPVSPAVSLLGLRLNLLMQRLNMDAFTV